MRLHRSAALAVDEVEHLEADVEAQIRLRPAPQLVQQGDLGAKHAQHPPPNAAIAFGSASVKAGAHGKSASVSLASASGGANAASSFVASAVAASLASRFGYPPARIIGAVLPVSQFMRTLGDVVAGSTGIATG